MLFQVFSQSSFHTAAEDVTSRVLEVVEAPLPDGRCPHPYLVKRKEEDVCYLPGRIDMFPHYAMTGGMYGAKV